MAEDLLRVILYEYPLNERIRTYLRLEHLFGHLLSLVARESAMDHHFALVTLFEILDVGTRADLKSEIMKDLDRQKTHFEAYRGNPAIAEGALDQLIGDLSARFDELNQLTGKAGHALTENDWLMSIRSRISIPGGTCEFDLPAYYAWQFQPPALRQHDLSKWIAGLMPVSHAIALLLKLLRDSGAPQKVMANAGQFQQSLPQGRSFQLLRLALDPALALIPEISANRLLVSVRLMQQGPDDKPHLSSADASFELALCA